LRDACEAIDLKRSASHARARLPHADVAISEDALVRKFVVLRVRGKDKFRQLAAASNVAARLDLSAAEALTALKSVRLVDIALGDGTTKRSVTHGSQRAATVLRALGITELDPPTPPQQGETVM
jgi:hypothetical protein